MNKQVIVIGAGGHGRVIGDIITACGDHVAGFLDDRPAEDFSGLAILGKISAISDLAGDFRFIIGIGNNAVRRQLSEQYALSWYTAIHPSAVISPSATIEEGTAVMANAVVNAAARVGKHTIINTAAIIEHDNNIGDYCHISPRAALGGTVRIGNDTHIGIGAVVINNIEICHHCIIGAGAAVIRDICEPGTYAGVPARKIC